MNSAWECRDQADQAEIYYNQPLRTQNRHLQEEVLSLKKLLRENGIAWRPESAQEPRASAPRSSNSTRITRSCSKRSRKLPHIPVEIQLRILSYAMTSSIPIVDPMSKVRSDRLLLTEKTKSNQIAINFLTTCRAYHVEGTTYLWNNNTFVFTTPEALKTFAEVPLLHRMMIRSVNFRIIAKFYDDEDRIHKLPSSYHPDFKKPKKLVVHRRPKDHALARRGFRAYAYYQLIDFLEAMLPPHDPTDGTTDFELLKAEKRPRLLPNLERIRIDFVNFGEDMLMYPPAHLHDLASHQMGCSLNEVMLTGLPSDEAGFRVSSELSGLLKDEGLLIDHAPTMIALRNGIRALPCDDDECHYSSKVVRAMRSAVRLGIGGVPHTNNNSQPPHHHNHQEEFPPAPKDEGDPPPNMYHSCRTMWKKVPIKLDDTEKRKWELFDRISGLPWDDVEEEILFLEMIEDNSDDGVPKCANCGQRHPGAILDDEFSDMYDDEI